MSSVKEILLPINSTLAEFETALKAVLDLHSLGENSLGLEEFIFAPSKRLRPAIIFLVAKALNSKISDEIMKIAISVELLHSATLIHDDIVDEAEIRRKLPTVVSLHGAKMATVAGDFLLAISLDNLCKVDNIKVFKHFSNATIQICKGEIEQNTDKFKVPSLENYISKSLNKTAPLFLAGVQSLFEVGVDVEFQGVVESFANDFALAFQIYDDILDFSGGDNLKSAVDSKNGIYTLPHIFYEHEKLNCDIIVAKQAALCKAQEYQGKLINEAIAKLDVLPQSEEKSALVALIKLFKE